MEEEEEEGMAGIITIVNCNDSLITCQNNVSLVLFALVSFSAQIGHNPSFGQVVAKRTRLVEIAPFKYPWLKITASR